VNDAILLSEFARVNCTDGQGWNLADLQNILNAIPELRQFSLDQHLVVSDLFEECSEMCVALCSGALRVALWLPLCARVRLSIPFKSKPSCLQRSRFFALNASEVPTLTASSQSGQAYAVCPSRSRPTHFFAHDPWKVARFIEATSFMKDTSEVEAASCAVLRALFPKDSQVKLDQLEREGFMFPSGSLLRRARPRFDIACMLLSRRWFHSVFRTSISLNITCDASPITGSEIMGALLDASLPPL
jgi:hypothetical protein